MSGQKYLMCYKKSTPFLACSANPNKYTINLYEQFLFELTKIIEFTGHILNF